MLQPRIKLDKLDHNAYDYVYIREGSVDKSNLNTGSVLGKTETNCIKTYPTRQPF
ncbi:hypothetical protein TorRG33x02_096970 [Trema orientale]|uniref:Uncharacterized protein n=1 Tax=Trema orientale TaxID=63057 RepID=A0A2P5F9I5_TREOI|nr:hypothetical protein TorRG33x02_096970 [Trema orientale]